MFKETTANTQMSMFDNSADLMEKRAVKKYEDPKAWFNQFYALVTSQIDESVFRPLFKEVNMGAPTASICQLVAMSILKEGFDCSDENLMETCFSRLTGFQAAKFKISGKSIRMDSKIIGSNIVWYPATSLSTRPSFRRWGST